MGEGQSIGNPLTFGGPYVGLFATKQKYLRQMPGRIAGETVDAEGKRGLVLTLSTREQHIRRDKATSNICTNSGLCALAFSIHMTLLGETGLRRLARLNHANAVKLADALGAAGVEVLNETFFNEFTVRVKGDAAALVERMAAHGVLGGVPVSRLLPNAGVDDLLIIASTEINTDEDRAALVAALRSKGPHMLNNQGRPTQPNSNDAPDDSAHHSRKTFTGHRALAMEEALIFESRPRGSHRRRCRRTGGLHAAPRRPRAHDAHRSAGPFRARDDAPLRAPVAEELRHRYWPLSARLVHDEAQSAPQRAHGPPAGLWRHSSASAAFRPCRARSNSSTCSATG